jgi:hypothetical protein
MLIAIHGHDVLHVLQSFHDPLSRLLSSLEHGRQSRYEIDK